MYLCPGFAFDILEFAVKSFLVGSWNPVQVISSALRAFQDDIRLHLIAALSMAVALSPIGNKQDRDDAEEDIVGHIIRIMEPLRTAPSNATLSNACKFPCGPHHPLSMSAFLCYKILHS